MKKIIRTVCIVILLFLIFILLYFLFNKFFSHQKIIFIQVSLSAFMGAFFAFLFTKLAELLTKISGRTQKHYNALVKIEQCFNDYLNYISDNRFLIKNFIKSLKDGGIYIVRFSLLPIEKDITLELLDLSLMNKIFSFNINVRKMNNSMETVNTMYDEIKKAYLEGVINHDDYKINSENIIKKLQDLDSFLISLEKKTIDILALVRILLIDKPFPVRIVHIFSRDKSLEISEERIISEKKKLNLEIEKIAKESKKEIEEVLKIKEDI
jgi:hypothetical protein